MIEELKNKIRNVFKIGIKSETSSERLIKVTFQGKTQSAVLYLPYGIFANPKDDLPTGLLADQCNEESLIAMPMDIENREELEDGEIAFGVPSLDARIFFRENGNITFKIGSQEGGDYAARFNELKSGFDELKGDFNGFLTHVHGASGTPPVPPAIPSTASIDSAKIDEIEFPS